MRRLQALSEVIQLGNVPEPILESSVGFYLLMVFSVLMFQTLFPPLQCRRSCSYVPHAGGDTGSEK